MLTPTLGLLLGEHNSVGLLQAAKSAEGLCDLVVAMDTHLAERRPDLLMLARALAPTHLLSLVSAQDVEGWATTVGCAAVTTFSDELCAIRDAAIGQSGTATLDKFVSRQVLNSAGISTRKAQAITGRHAEQQIIDFAEDVGWPVVLKPRAGVSSRNVYLLESGSDAAAALRCIDSDVALFVEDFIPTMPSHAFVDDYLSVEVFQRGGGRSDAFATDRLPAAPPFRESGLVLPSVCDAATLDQLITLSTSAVSALTQSRGAYHIEVKNRAAPEIIEVNRRLGGYVATLASMASSVDVVRHSMACSLGLADDLAVDWQQAAAVLIHQPSQLATQLMATPGRRNLLRLPGVVSVGELSPARTGIDWRRGTDAHVALVYVQADDLDRLYKRLCAIGRYLVDHTTYQDENGDTFVDDYQEWHERY